MHLFQSIHNRKEQIPRLFQKTTVHPGIPDNISDLSPSGIPSQYTHFPVPQNNLKPLRFLFTECREAITLASRRKFRISFSLVSPGGGHNSFITTFLLIFLVDCKPGNSKTTFSKCFFQTISIISYISFLCCFSHIFFPSVKKSCIRSSYFDIILYHFILCINPTKKIDPAVRCRLNNDTVF